MLPYHSVGEAEDAIGRPLSFFEILWFNYSSRKSDYFLYCHNIIFLFIAFSFVPLPYVFFQFFGFLPFDRHKIQPNIRLTLYETFRCYRDVITSFLFVVGPLQLVSYPVVHFVGIRTSLPLPSAGEFMLKLLFYFIVEDYSNYWIHRFFHCKWAYEKIHRVHHEYTAPIGFAAPYAHWVEILILGIPSFIGPAMVPAHMITFWSWIVLRQVEAIETHSGYEFPWSPSKWIPFYGGAEYHDYHHYVGGQSQSNFGSVFTYCDYIYGTDKGYKCYKNMVGKLKEEDGRDGGGIIILGNKTRKND